MATVVQMILLFIIGATVGWTVEFFYRRIKHGNWVNPGFLAGPTLPLYGFGLVGMYLIASIDFGTASEFLQKFISIIILCIVVNSMAFITGLVFTQFFKVRLWDYSDRKGNVKGIVCPLFSLIWSVIVAVYCLFFHDLLTGVISGLTDNSVLVLIIGIYIGIFIIDNVYSFNVVARIGKWAKDNGFVIKYERLKDTVKEKARRFKNRILFLLPFRTKDGLNSELEYYKGNYSDKRQSVKNNDLKF